MKKKQKKLSEIWMDRDEALKIVDGLVKTPNIRKHCLAAEAAMLGLWDYFRAKINRAEKMSDASMLHRRGHHFDKKGKIDWGSREEWGIVGLLHDADYEITNKSLELHTEETTKKLKEMDAPKEIIDGVRGHCGKEPRKLLVAKAIYAVDEMTGLIVAAALVRPDKKLESLTVKSVLKRFKELSFAKGADRDQIKTCEKELGIKLSEFTEIILKSMKRISNEIGL